MKIRSRRKKKKDDYKWSSFVDTYKSDGYSLREVETTDENESIMRERLQFLDLWEKALYERKRNLKIKEWENELIK